jgi:uncharacterized damage-inducible protein DinB
MSESNLPEPWLRGTLTEVSPLLRAVLHALQLAREDVEAWCGSLSDRELNARPAELPSVAFHISHMARSVDRLLTYAEGDSLNEAQLLGLKTEQEARGKMELFAEFTASLENAEARIRNFRPSELDERRSVGKKHLSTTAGGLLVHIADHTQRHVGQAITTAKVVMRARDQSELPVL